MKKVISAIVAIILATTFCGMLTACNNSDELENSISNLEQEIEQLQNSNQQNKEAIQLAANKQNAVEEISNYANKANEDNFYSYSNYEIIMAKLNNYIKNITGATTEDAISNNVTEFKNEIDKIATTEVSFTCYTLQEAYDNGFLSYKDLQAMYEYYLNDDSEELAIKYEHAILESYAIINGYDYSIQNNIAKIKNYYGIYNGYIPEK